MSQIPPVIFPSGAGATSSTNPTQPPNHQRRHQPHPQFTPLPTNPNLSTTTSIPFISFDVAAAATTTTTTPFSYSSPPPSLGSGGSLNFDAEPPLLEELGINTKQIWSKTLSILNPFKIRVSGHEDADLSGPFVVLLGFGLFQLLAGKFHFGVLLGWLTVAAVWFYVVFNMLAGGRNHGSLDLHRCVSLIGYCMLPVALLAGVALFVPKGGAVVLGSAGLGVVWSTRVCTKLMIEVSGTGEEHRGIHNFSSMILRNIRSKFARASFPLRYMKVMALKAASCTWLDRVSH
ncbi:YIPF5-like protein, partial [Drosera capensis]